MHFCVCDLAMPMWNGFTSQSITLPLFYVYVQLAFVLAHIWLIWGTSIIYQGWTSWVALSLRGASYSDASMALSEMGPVASVLVNSVGLTVAV